MKGINRTTLKLKDVSQELFRRLHTCQAQMTEVVKIKLQVFDGEWVLHVTNSYSPPSQDGYFGVSEFDLKKRITKRDCLNRARLLIALCYKEWIESFSQPAVTGKQQGVKDE